MYSLDTMSITSSTSSTLYSASKRSIASTFSLEGVPRKKLCYIGDHQKEAISKIAHNYGLSIVTSKDGEKYSDDPSVIFVLDDFELELPEKLSQLTGRVYGVTALLECTWQLWPLPRSRRPLLSFVMQGVSTCFTGITDRAAAVRMMKMIRFMNGSVRREPTHDTTHVIAGGTTGRKYEYATTFVIPVMSPEWVEECWKRRLELHVRATEEELMKHRQKPFLNVFVSLVGFPEVERDEMVDLLVLHGGTLVEASDLRCTHIVVDDICPVRVPADAARAAYVVSPSWFWASIQHVVRENETNYEVARDCLRPKLKRTLPVHWNREAGDEEMRLLKYPIPYRSRSRLLAQLSVEEESQPDTREHGVQSPGATDSPCTPDLFRRHPTEQRSTPHFQSAGSCARSLNLESEEAPVPQKDHRSGQPISARLGAFMELLHTEENYVGILDTVLQMRSEALSTSQAGGMLLSQTEARIIFGPLMPIARTHHALLKEMRCIFNNWTEDANIGEPLQKYSPDLLRDYTPFVSSFEEAKEMINKVSERNPRFLAFLKVCRSRPECGRQELGELLIRPVQRLGSSRLLLREILKHTPEGSPDRKSLESALESLSEVLSLINEDKRKMESLSKVFDIYNLVTSCPADIIASHRTLIVHFEGLELTSHGFSKSGDQIAFFVFTDILLVCKKKSKVVAQTKGRSGWEFIPNRVMKIVGGKPYKFLQILPLSSIRKIVDVGSKEGTLPFLGVVFRLKNDSRESCSYFRLTDDCDKSQIIERWSCTLATHTCVPDPEKFIQVETEEESALGNPDFLSNHRRKAAKMAAKTQAFMNNALGLVRVPSSSSTASASSPPCAMSTFNSTSRLPIMQTEAIVQSSLDEDGDVKCSPKTASLTAMIMKKL